MKPIWTEIDFRLSVVNRWQVMPTIRKQSVAEHQHNVAKIAERLAEEVFGVIDYTTLYLVVAYALEHDDLEAVIGDPPSYTKPYLDEQTMALDFAPFMRDPPEDPPMLVRIIVKCADYIDAAVFLRVEISMGNRTVVGVLRDLERRFKYYCEDRACLGAYHAYETVVDTMFGGNGQLTIEGFRFK
jgi:hypothetical protein